MISLLNIHQNGYLSMQNHEILDEIQKVLQARKSASDEQSYVASLYSKGLDHILKKVGEESSEVIIAAKGSDSVELTKEVADLWFHCMVMLANKNIDVNDVLTELSDRFGISGIEEKASRVVKN